MIKKFYLSESKRSIRFDLYLKTLEDRLEKLKNKNKIMKGS